MNLQWHCLRFPQLRPEQIYELGKLRQEVFVVEQQAAYLDFDGKDYQALHCFAHEPGQNQILAYARILPPNLVYPEALSIGRVANHPSTRGLGLGRQLFDYAMRQSLEHFGPLPVKISAQTYLERFYQSFHFRLTPKRYLEDGLPHVEMHFPTAHWRYFQN